MRVGFVAKHARALIPEADGFNNDRTIICRPARFSAADPRGESSIAQITSRRIGQERLDAGACEAHGPFAGLSAVRSEARCRVTPPFRQALKVGLFEQQEPARLVGEHILREFGAEHRKPCVIFRVPFLLIRRQKHTRPHKAVIGQLKQPLLLPRQPEALSLFPDRLHATEERLA